MKYLELVKGLFTTDHKVRAKQADPYVAYSKQADSFMFTIAPEPVAIGPWVAFIAEEDNSSIGLKYLSKKQALEYSTNTTTWNTFDTTTNISLNNGDKVYIRGMLSANNSTFEFTRFNMTGKIAASGNCNAIWNYKDLDASLKAYCGYSMFNGCTSLTKAPELPATTLTEGCYYSMFNECTSLTKAPELPATTLTTSCYANMFQNCTSLTTSPELPATKLASRCYSQMFNNCTSLTTSPKILPATALADNCYWNMFTYCKSLTTAPELPATTLAGYCYHGMFGGCSSLTTAPELPATTLAGYCYHGMFRDCTSLETAPELPATTLTDGCYGYMFDRCTNLNYITCLATNISASGCTSFWISGIPSTGTFVKHPDMNSWSSNNHGIPSGWTVVDAEIQ